MNDQVDRSANSGRTKDAIIAAIASVLVAVIGVGGLYLTSSHRDRDRAEADVERSAQEAKVLRADVSSLQVALKKANDALLRCGKPGDFIRTTLPVPAADTAREQTEEGFSVSLKRCLRSGTTIDCELAVLNHGPQQELTLVAAPPNSSDSRTIDDRGQQLKANGGTVAGISGDYVRFDAPSNITLPGVVRFRDVPPEVKQFQLIEVSFTGHRDFKVQFHDVEIESR
jgi:hypothetical protein